MAIEIRKVERDSEWAAELLSFIRQCSWVEVRDHLAGMLESWAFTDWETVFAAVSDGQVAGMCTLLKTDYYPLPEIYPWVSSVFVETPYRGQRISQQLIDFANGYAKALGFQRTYIPSEHVGLYEKYGYVYVRNIVNYGGGVDRLYVKELGE